MVPLAALTLVWQLATVPPLPAKRQSGAEDTFKLLGRPQVATGMLAILFLFLGQFALFTYLRPFLETVTRVDVSTLSLLLLVLGVTGLIGTYLVGWCLRASMYGVLVAIPLGMAAVAIALLTSGHQVAATGALLTGWGFVGTPAPVGWGTWLSEALPEDAEAGGGLMVATIQLAITLEGSVNGLLFDASGYWSAFGVSAAILFTSAVLAFLTWRIGKLEPSEQAPRFPTALPT